LNERIGRTGRQMRNAGAAASAASAGLLFAFRDSLGLYDQQARSEAKVAAAIEATGGAAGFTAEQLGKEASALQGLTRYGDEDILNKVTAQFLTFKNVSGDIFLDAQKGALDLATTLDGDLQSASIMLGKALNDPVKGLSAMSRAGVTFSEDQETVIKRLAETGRIAEAQRMILDELASAYGGQAEAAAASGLGALDQMTNAWGDVKEVVGQIVGEALLPAAKAVKSVAEAFQGMSPTMQRFIVYGGAAAVALGPLVAAAGLVAVGIGAIGLPVAAAVAGFAALGVGVAALWPKFVELKDVAADVFGRVPEIIGAAVEAVRGWLDDKLSGIMDRVTGRVAAVGDAFGRLYDRVVGNSYVPDLIRGVAAWFDRLAPDMVAPTESATDAAATEFETMAERIGSRLGELTSSGKLTWRSFMDTMLETGRDYANRIIGDVFDRIASGASGALGQAGATGGGAGGGFMGAATSALGGFFRNLLPFETGGSFTVRGRAGSDRNVVPIRASAGETVDVRRPGSSSAPIVNVTIQTPNPAAFQASRAQVGAQLGRAVAAGQRGM
jgi:hypothetical protein